MNLGFEREKTPQEVLEWKKALSLHLASNPGDVHLFNGKAWLSDSHPAAATALVSGLAAYVEQSEVFILSANAAAMALKHEDEVMFSGFLMPQLWFFNFQEESTIPLAVLNFNMPGDDAVWHFASFEIPRGYKDLRIGIGKVTTESDEFFESALIQTLGFMLSRVPVKERPSFNRAARRQLERQNIDHSKIQIITLRKGEPHEPKGARQVEWSCQWDVRPFYGIRHTKEGPKRVLISGHRKGPEGKPLKERGEVVSLVKR